MPLLEAVGGRGPPALIGSDDSDSDVPPLMPSDDDEMPPLMPSDRPKGGNRATVVVDDDDDDMPPPLMPDRPIGGNRAAFVDNDDDGSDEMPPLEPDTSRQQIHAPKLIGSPR